MFLIYLYIRFKLFLTGKNGFEQFSVVLCRKLKTLRERSVLWHNMHPAYGTLLGFCLIVIVGLKPRRYNTKPCLRHYKAEILHKPVP
jgi:hypothetical protein